MNLGHLGDFPGAICAIAHHPRPNDGPLIRNTKNRRIAPFKPGDDNQLKFISSRGMQNRRHQFCGLAHSLSLFVRAYLG